MCGVPIRFVQSFVGGQRRTPRGRKWSEHLLDEGAKLLCRLANQALGLATVGDQAVRLQSSFKGGQSLLLRNLTEENQIFMLRKFLFRDRIVWTSKFEFSNEGIINCIFK